MTGALLIALAFGSAWAGFCALSLAMERHFQDAFGRQRQGFERWRPWLRAAGAAGLGLSLIACLWPHGAAQGWVLWLGVLTAAALAQVLALSGVFRAY
ncbi:DUF3325 domain-containing protein [Ottowia testudinis]|uniref:DUF3325 domain-containing protein n=1 Tax=Ottowia testudinis TaxID=2816950 RepID=A0A975CLG2_9BURK|nr:DUF3325 domain-containing protein [Ottowia testudinis]QTD46364.1 DUF3325 domain-containing protein [Ottowia testudinis]